MVSQPINASRSTAALVASRVKAMILAAGRGTRMGELTQTTPKPLLRVQGVPLIEWHLRKLAAAGIDEVIINLAYLGEQIRDYLGDGSRWGVRLAYSVEPEPLETGGAIWHAREYLGAEPFLLINADVYTDMDYSFWRERTLSVTALGHLLLVPNPDFKTRGDFDLAADGQLQILDDSASGYTFAGISLLRPGLITDYPHCRQVFPLVETFHYALKQGCLRGEVYTGLWSDVGTPERLAALNAESPIR